MVLLGATGFTGKWEPEWRGSTGSGEGRVLGELGVLGVRGRGCTGRTGRDRLAVLGAGSGGYWLYWECE